MNATIDPSILVGFSAWARTRFHRADPTFLAMSMCGSAKAWTTLHHHYSYAEFQRLQVNAKKLAALKGVPEVQAQGAKLAALTPCPRCFERF